MAQYSEHLEREAVGIRTQGERTIEELRECLSPRQFVDQIIDYARGGAPAELAQNLGREIMRNPLPAALIGSGLAWLMIRCATAGNGSASGPALSISGRIADAGEAESNAGDSLSGAAGTAASRAAERARNVGESIKTAATASADMASDMAAGARDQISSFAGQARDAAGSIKDKAGTGLRTACGEDKRSRADRQRKRQFFWAKRAKQRPRFYSVLPGPAAGAGGSRACGRRGARHLAAFDRDGVSPHGRDERSSETIRH